MILNGVTDSKGICATCIRFVLHAHSYETPIDNDYFMQSFELIVFYINNTIA